MNFTLDKWDILLIRACKSNGDFIRRLRKIFRTKCGLPKEYNIDDGLAHHLLGLIETVPNISMRSVIEDLNPQNHYKHGIENDEYYIQVIKICRSLIRHENVDSWNNFVVPVKFRKK